jgi:hypothetical protein
MLADVFPRHLYFLFLDCLFIVAGPIITNSLAFCKLFVIKFLLFFRKSPVAQEIRPIVQILQLCSFAKTGEITHSDFRQDVQIPISAKTGTHSCRLQITNGLGLFCIVDNCFCDAIGGFAGLVVRVAGFDLFCNLGKPTLAWSAAKDQELVVNCLLFSQLSFLLWAFIIIVA